MLVNIASFKVDDIVFPSYTADNTNAIKLSAPFPACIDNKTKSIIISNLFANFPNEDCASLDVNAVHSDFGLFKGPLQLFQDSSAITRISQGIRCQPKVVSETLRNFNIDITSKISSLGNSDKWLVATDCLIQTKQVIILWLPHLDELNQDRLYSQLINKLSSEQLAIVIQYLHKDGEILEGASPIYEPLFHDLSADTNG